MQREFDDNMPKTSAASPEPSRWADEMTDRLQRVSKRIAVCRDQTTRFLDRARGDRPTGVNVEERAGPSRSGAMGEIESALIDVEEISLALEAEAEQLNEVL